jgi:Tol biopolymer transport system component
MAQKCGHTRIALLVTCLLASSLVPSDLMAQYFGQNKVRYETFDFKILKTEHFEIYYYDEEMAAVQDFARMAERWYTRLSTVLDYQLRKTQPVIVYASHPAFRGTTVIPDAIGESTGGVTEGLRNRVIMPLAGPLKETDHVLGHELVHAFQYDITTRGDIPGAALLPLWFIEGMAEYLSVGPVDSQTAMWMRDAVRRNQLPEIDKLDHPDYFPYRYGQALWAYIGGRYGDDVVGRILRQAGESGDAKSAIQRVLGIDTKTLSQEWQQALQRDYQPILQATVSPSDFGKLLVEGKRNQGEINVAPALSPDGSRMVFFSQRDLFSIDLYLADANTGEIQDKLTESAIDPHIDSMQFVNSAGDWSPDGKKFAFGAIRSGRPELSIYDTEEKRVERQIQLRTLGEINNLSWSPNGQAIAFSAVAGGVTDLFVVDLSNENIRRLTDDAFADLQPAWSPDGTRIAFVTDRFTTDLATLSFGQYRLALLDPATGRIESVAGFEEGKHLNPQWSADNRSIYFISDRDGIPNVYRLQRANGALYQVTNLQTGVSGITNMSPALAVASRGSGVVFTSFAEGTYSLRRIDEPTQLAGRAVPSALGLVSAAILPPRTATPGQVSRMIRDSRQGLRSSQEFTTKDYSPRLSLEYIAPPSVTAGVSNFGSMVGGGTTLVFGDLLGHHSVFTTFQTSFSTEGGNLLNNLSALAGYQNQKSRWTWGFSGGQVPYATGDFSQTLADFGGTTVLVDRSVQFWQINRELQGYFAYPFNRAQRIEFSTGYRHISFDAEEKTDVYDLTTGERIDNQTTDIDTPSPLNLGTAAAALVYDTSIFGGTSPVKGRRYRFELGGTGGALSYGSLLGDFRQYYQIARPLSLAGRLLYTGRFGGDARDPRLQDLFVGYDSLVRGYSASSFTASECGLAAQQSGTCPVFDQLLGSQIAVANAELRMPILGALGVIRSPGVPPVEAALFYDTGVAWTPSDKAGFLGGSRRPVSSYGSSLRVNILGFAIGQLSLVHPNDRPGARKWSWEFSLLPGF